MHTHAACDAWLRANENPAVLLRVLWQRVRAMLGDVFLVNTGSRTNVVGSRRTVHALEVQTSADVITSSAWPRILALRRGFGVQSTQTRCHHTPTSTHTHTHTAWHTHRSIGAALLRSGVDKNNNKVSYRKEITRQHFCVTTRAWRVADPLMQFEHHAKYGCTCRTVWAYKIKWPHIGNHKSLIFY